MDALMTELTRPDQLEEAITDTKLVFLFKHSTHCVISSNAKEQMDAFTIQHEDNKEYAFYLIEVIEHRDISDLVAEYFNITHESPQLIVLKNKKVLFHMSHDAITIEEINEHLSKL